MTDAATLADLKAAARTAAFARRRAAHAARTPAAADRLRAELGRFAGRALAGYMPMRTEIDCLPAMEAHDGPVAVPVILAPGEALRFRRWTPQARMVPGDFGALIPEAGDWIEPRVLIVPLLAFDRRGYRLGYGGGFYDRTLEGLRARGPVTAIGFAFAAQEVAAVPTEATDQRLDLIITEDETIAPGA
jgi:5-formyltetrahydrofolate cyclo-ligase